METPLGGVDRERPPSRESWSETSQFHSKTERHDGLQREQVTSKKVNILKWQKQNKQKQNKCYVLK